jgi:cation diffusion facilitator CzcD-associated flavoprotein CzcO
MSSTPSDIPQLTIDLVLADVKKLYHIIRSPTAILPPRLATMKAGAFAPLLEKIELDAQENFTPEQIARFKSDPAFYETFTSALELDSNIKFVIALMKDSPQQKWASGKVREFMTAMLRGDEKLCSQLIPNYPLGCRRMTPAPGYLESFQDPRVELRSKAIKSATKSGLVLEDGEVLEVDAIICATGFDSSFRPVYPLVGRKGNLQDIWARETPKSYMSLAVDGCPNYFSEFPYLPSQDYQMLTFPSLPRVPRPQRPHRPRCRLHPLRAHRHLHRQPHRQGTIRRHSIHDTLDCRR